MVYIKNLERGALSLLFVTTLLLGLSNLAGFGSTFGASNFTLEAWPSPSESYSWTPNGTLFCSATNNQVNPQIVSDGVGGAIITWADYRGANTDIFAQRIDSMGNGLWNSNGVTICNATLGQLTPQITSDGAGGAIIAWEDYRNGNVDIYAQRVASSGSVQWEANGTAICTYIDNQRGHQLISDGVGGAIIVWHDNGSEINLDIYAQRINSSGSIKWEIDGALICNQADDQENPQLVSDGAEGAIITWQDNRTGNLDIYAQHVNSTGIRQWGLPGKSICNSNNNQLVPRIASDGNGGAIICWEDFRNGIYDIYAQRINFTGANQWTINGTVICNATNQQYFPEIVSDGTDGAIIVWEDLRSGVRNLYAQRVDSAGLAQWSANGTAICTETGQERYPKLTNDGTSGAIITWYDDRYGTNDIFAQRVDSAGIIKWAANGTAICTMTGIQRNPQIVSDGAGGTIVAWEDARTGIYDIFTQRIINLPPTTNNPADISTTKTGTETIGWILSDDQGPGQYRVIVTGVSGSRVWMDLTPWANSMALNVPIDRIAVGTFSYTIEYMDDQGTWGFTDAVVVIIAEAGIPGFQIVVLLIVAGFTTLKLTKRARDSAHT